MSSQAEAGAEQPQYPLEGSANELRRLALQAKKQRSATKRLFRAAGIGAGMRVLDVGTGAGHVAILVATLVGESGCVVGIDRNDRYFSYARECCSEARLTNVRFELGDLNHPPAGPFDAVVGRYVLMFQADPGVSIRSLASHLASRGVMAFIELAMPLGPIGGGTLNSMTWPETQDLELLSRSCRSWIHDAYTAAQVRPLMGLELPSLFSDAGLDSKGIFDVTCSFYTGREAADTTAALLRSLLDVVIENGIATAEEVDVETLADRILAAAGTQELILVGQPAVAAWARKP